MPEPLKRLGQILVAICLSQVAVACDPPTAAPSRDLVLPDVVVTRDNPVAAPGCRPADVAQFVMGFLEHVRGGEVDIERYFAPAESFSWYSATTGDPRSGGHRFWGKDLDRLPRYFRERQRQHETMMLKKILVRSEAESGTASIVFELRRTADDLAEFDVTHDVATGKGGIDCANDRIIQWSLFQPVQPDGSTSGLCPTPVGPVADKAVACAPAEEMD